MTSSSRGAIAVHCKVFAAGDANPGVTRALMRAMTMVGARTTVMQEVTEIAVIDLKVVWQTCKWLQLYPCTVAFI